MLEVPEPGLSSHCGPGATQAEVRRLKRTQKSRLMGEGREGMEWSRRSTRTPGQDPVSHV